MKSIESISNNSYLKIYFLAQTTKSDDRFEAAFNEDSKTDQDTIIDSITEAILYLDDYPSPIDLGKLTKIIAIYFYGLENIPHHLIDLGFQESLEGFDFKKFQRVLIHKLIHKQLNNKYEFRDRNILERFNIDFNRNLIPEMRKLTKCDFNFVKSIGSEEKFYTLEIIFY